jgi:hypothetical protein
MHIRNSLIAFAIAATIASPQSARAQSDTSNCSKVTQQILEGPIASVEAAKLAQKLYAEQNAKQIAELREHIALCKTLHKYHDAVRAKEKERTQQEVTHAQTAIREGIAAAQRQIADIRKRIQELLRLKKHREVQGLQKRIANIQRLVASGEWDHYSRHLGHRRTLNGWRDYIKAKQKWDRDRAALHASGELDTYVRELGHSATWNSILERIDSYEKRVAQAVQRLPSYYLRPLGHSAHGEGVDQLLANRQKFLMDLEEQIAMGEYDVYVGVLGHRATRNGVQSMIHQSKERYRALQDSWRDRSYTAYSSLYGHQISRGALEQRKSKLAATKAQFERLGEGTPLHVSNLGVKTGTELKAKIAAARSIHEEKVAEHWGKQYARWQEARQHRAKQLRKDTERVDAALVEHEKQFRDASQRGMDEFKVRLKNALAQTPCGGSKEHDTRRYRVDKPRKALTRMGKNEKDPDKRRELYDDEIFVEDDGTVHGDPKEAWKKALSDLDMGDGKMPVSDWILWIKNHADWLCGVHDSAEVAELTHKIGQFTKEIENLDPSQLSPEEFFKKRNEIRKLLVGLEETLDKGILSPESMKRAIAALQKRGAQTETIKKQIAGLQQMLKRSQDARAMWKNWGLAKSLTMNLGKEAMQKYRSFADSSVKQMSGKLGNWWKGQSKMAKGLFVLSVAASAAEAYQNTQKGMATSEAIARSSVNFVLDLVIAGCPVTAAAEMGTQVLFTSYSVATGEKGPSDATLSNTTKFVAQKALDLVAAGGDGAGRLSVALERMASGSASSREVLASLDYTQVRAAQIRVEERLSALPPGHPDEARLLRARRAFRRLMRAQRGLEF